jgi:hypothetical protein
MAFQEMLIQKATAQLAVCCLSATHCVSCGMEIFPLVIQFLLMETFPTTKCIHPIQYPYLSLILKLVCWHVLFIVGTCVFKTV